MTARSDKQASGARATKLTSYFHGCRNAGRKEGAAICIIIGDVTIRIWEPIVGHNKLSIDVVK